MKNIKAGLSVLVLTAAILFTAGPAVHAFWDEKKSETLDEAMKKIAGELAEELKDKTELKDKGVLFASQNFYDEKTGLCLPLAKYICDRLKTEMSNRDIRILRDGWDENEALIISGYWQQINDTLSIHVQVTELTNKGPEAPADACDTIPLSAVNKNELEPNLNSWAKLFIRKLEQQTQNKNLQKKPLNINLEKLKVGGRNQSLDEIEEFLMGELFPALGDSIIFKTMNQKENLRGVSAREIMTRGVRPNVKTASAAETGDDPSITSKIMNADAELRGTLWLFKNSVKVQLQVLDVKTSVFLAAVSEHIPSKLFPVDMVTVKVYEADYNNETTYKDEAVTPGTLSYNGLVIDITSNAGNRKPVFRDREPIEFYIELNRPAWVYLFDLDSNGNVTLLYPVDENFNLDASGKCGKRLSSSERLMIPHAGCSTYLEATEPFGTDTILAVASEEQLPLKNLPGREWTRSESFEFKILNLGRRSGKGYAETRLKIETRP